MAQGERKAEAGGGDLLDDLLYPLPDQLHQRNTHPGRRGLDSDRVSQRSWVCTGRR